MSHTRKLMLCVDGSEHSERCFKWYLDNIHKDGDVVVIVHAQEIPQLPAAPYPYGYAYYQEWDKLVQEGNVKVKGLLEAYGKQCKARKVECKLIKEAGDPGHVLCKNAEEEDCRIVFIGTRGMGVVRRTIMGSVSDYMVHHSKVPVVVIPPPHH